MIKDPICGMKIEESKAIKLTQDGLIYYFCSENCRQRFLMQSPANKSAASESKTVYTCPMHPEIRQDKSGDCPRCGMHLEPVSPEARDNEEYKLLHDLSRKFWIGLIFTIPIVLLVVLEMIPAINLKLFIPDWISSWIQFLDRKSTRLNSSHSAKSRMPSSA